MLRNTLVALCVLILSGCVSTAESQNIQPVDPVNPPVIVHQSPPRPMLCVTGAKQFFKQLKENQPGMKTVAIGLVKKDGGGRVVIIKFEDGSFAFYTMGEDDTACLWIGGWYFRYVEDKSVKKEKTGSES